MRLLIRWGIACVALLVTVRFVPGMHLTRDWVSVVIAAAAIGLLNILSRPVLWVMHLLTFPVSCLTFGLWSFFLAWVVDGLVFYYVGAHRWGFWLEGFTVTVARIGPITFSPLGAAFVGAAVMAAVSAILNGFFQPLGRHRRAG